MRKRSTTAAVKDVLIKSSTVECVRGTGLRSNDAARKHVPTRRSKEVRALSTVQRLYANDAAGKDAQIKLSKEDFALSMVQSVNNAAVKDALQCLKWQDCVTGMDQRGKNDVAANDAPIKPSKEACAGGIEQRCGYVPLKDAQS